MSRESFLPMFDGTRVFYEVEGEGAYDVILCDGIGCDGFIWRYLRPHLVERARVIHPHMRGHGCSEPPRDSAVMAIGHIVDDFKRVLDEEGSRRVVVMGHSMGVQVALEPWHRDPERVAGLALFCGSFENPVATFRDGPVLRRALPFLRLLASRVASPVRTAWQKLVPSPMSFLLAKLMEIHPDFVRPQDFLPYLDHLAKMDPKVFFDMLAGAEAHSAGGYLTRIPVPVLIVAGEQDRFTPAWLSEQMAHRIPTSELLLVHDGTHTAPIEHPTLVNLRVEQFLDTHFAAAEPHGKTRAAS